MGGESRSVLWRNWRSAAGRARRRVFGLIGACLGMCLAPAGNAATLSWDPAVSGGVTLGGTGTWTTAAPSSWWNGSSNTTWTNSSANDAVFGGTAGTVSLGSSGLTAGDVQFNTAGYTLAFGIGGNARTLTINSLSGSALGSTTLIGNSTANTAGSVNITLNGDTSFNGIVANNGTGATSFQKAGTGRLTLAEGFNYTATGNFSFSGGAVRLGTTSNLPSALDFSGGVLELAAGNVSRIFDSFSGNRIRLNNAAADLGFAAIGADRTLTMTNGSDVTWGNSGFLVSSLILATANSTGKLTFTHQTAGSGRGLRLANASGTTTRTIRADNGTEPIDAEIAMPLMNGASAGQIGGFTKTGDGVLALSAVNSYTGTTSVSAGGLLVNGTTASASAVSVSAGAFLGGTGRVGGEVAVSGGIAPGSNGIGTLTTGSGVTWNSGNAWLFQLGTPALSLDAAKAGTNNDFLNVGSGFTQGSGSTFTFDFANTGADGWYKLVGYASTTFATGTNTSFQAQAGSLPNGKTATFVVDPSSTALYVQIVPEPGAMALAAVGVATLVYAGRRRRSA